MKTHWINFLHFYLPPTSGQETVQEAVERSYSWILMMAEKFPQWRFTANINGCLTELLHTYGYTEIINRFRRLIDSGQIELVDTLAYHPIAPLIPDGVIVRQIEKNKEINKKAFGVEAKGFFLPEMAYHPRLAHMLEAYGYRWLILDEISSRQQPIDWSKKYQLINSSLTVVYRSRQWSREYPPRLIRQQQNQLPPYIVTATDAELYGHRFVDWEGWLAGVLRDQGIQTEAISEYLRSLSATETTEPRASSWESLQAELERRNPFNLWFNKKNRIQKKLWQLAQLSLTEIKNHPADANKRWAEQHLDRGLASCTFWWASGRDFHLFGAPAWHPDEVEKGARELIKVVRTLSAPTATKLKAEKVYLSIKKLLWTKHWKQHAG